MDIWEIEPSDFTYALKLFYFSQSVYLAIISLTKMAMLFFYLHIFPYEWVRRSCYATLIWTVLSAVVILLLQILQCLPVLFTWEGWLYGGLEAPAPPHKCISIQYIAYAAAANNITLDVVILILPMPVLFNLMASWRHRLGIAFMFSLGSFITLVSCLRLQSLVQFAYTSNPSWEYTGVLIWSDIEMGTSMLVTSLPAIRKLWKHTKEKRRASASASTGTSPREVFFPKDSSGLSGESRPSGVGRCHPFEMTETEMSMFDDEPRKWPQVGSQLGPRPSVPDNLISVGRPAERHGSMV